MEACGELSEIPASTENFSPPDTGCESPSIPLVPHRDESGNCSLSNYSIYSIYSLSLVLVSYALYPNALLIPSLRLVHISIFANLPTKQCFPIAFISLTPLLFFVYELFYLMLSDFTSKDAHFYSSVIRWHVVIFYKIGG